MFSSKTNRGFYLDLEILRCTQGSSYPKLGLCFQLVYFSAVMNEYFFCTFVKETFSQKGLKFSIILKHMLV
jgi:hypothetical protein